ncbi:DUF4132 domain-containing protein [Kitasatospora sp. NPDC088134]|uniref:DUF4132 domain-containing protein n=1 Tax=Kitasatospora sp. NPDC088134 TaxID=3364071 RepID=UPI00382E07B4
MHDTEQQPYDRSRSGTVLRWRPGEQREWAARAGAAVRYPGDTDWAAEAPSRLAQDPAVACEFLLARPVSVLAPFLAHWRPEPTRIDGDALRAVLAAHGTAAVPAVLHAAEHRPAAFAALLLPVLDVRAARLLTPGLLGVKSLQEPARSWFVRHGTAGALCLLPDALGARGPVQAAAEQALRRAVAEQGRAALRAAAADQYGADMASALDRLLPAERAVPGTVDGADLALPSWLRVAELPPPVLLSGAVLPAAEVRRLLALLRPGCSGSAEAVAGCRPEALAEFGWALFEQWRSAGEPVEDGGVFAALGAFGDDGTARRLGALLRERAGRDGDRWVGQVLDVLVALGTDTALRQLHALAAHLPAGAVESRLAEVADGLGLTSDQLADRLAPDGTTVFDYGARAFTVGFDEHLRPYVVDDADGRREELPPPGPQDDPAAAATAQQRFAALVWDVRALADEQGRRLEAAMVAERVWGADEFRELLGYPLLGRLARRLVWIIDHTAFRIRPDGTVTSAYGSNYPLPEGSPAKLAHPLHLGPDLAAWSELFADAGLVQPFRQLARPVKALTREEAAGHRLPRFEGAVVPADRLLARHANGWRQVGGTDLYRQLPDGSRLVLTFAPDAPTPRPGRTLRSVQLTSGPDRLRPGPRRLASLEPVAASEVLLELEELTSPEA